MCSFTRTLTAHWLCCVLVEMTVAAHVKILVMGLSVGVSISLSSTLTPLFLLLPPRCLIHPAAVTAGEQPIYHAIETRSSHLLCAGIASYRPFNEQPT